MAKNFKDSLIAYCPMCEKEGKNPYHKTTIMDSNRKYTYTGTSKEPRIFCEPHKIYSKFNRSGQVDENKKDIKRMLLPVTESRGITPEQKRKNDLALELEYMKNRKDTGYIRTTPIRTGYLITA